MNVINQQQAAEITGVTDRRIRQLIREDDGCPADSEGRIPCDEFGEWLKRRILSGVIVTDDGTVLVYEHERARLTKAQADKTEIEVALLNGEVVKAEEVVKAWADREIACKTKLRGLPARLTPQIMAAKSLVEAQRIFQEAVDEALTALADELQADAERQLEADPARGDVELAPAAESDDDAMGGRETATERRG